MVSAKYPEITVQLTDEDGNAFHILGKTKKAMRRAGLPEEECNRYVAEAMNGDYGELLQTTMRWVTVE